MPYGADECLRVRRTRGVAIVTIEHPLASFSAEAITLAKAAVDAAELPIALGLLEEAHRFNEALATSAAERRTEWCLASGGQTPEVERDLAAIIDTYEE